MLSPLPTYQPFDLKSLKPFAKIKLVVLDLDGTLLESSESTLPKKVLELLRSLKSSSIRITLATGRTLKGVTTLLEELPILNNTPMILYNGNAIFNKGGSILYQKTIPNRSFKQIINLSSRFTVKVIAYICDLLGKETALGWSYSDRSEYEYNKMPVEWQEWSVVEKSITPSAIVIHTMGQNKEIAELSAELNKINDVSYSYGGNAYIEIRPKESNKGIALMEIAKYLKLKRNQILAIGDNDNDAEMLSWAGIGIAVDSASELAKKNSNYKTRGVIEGAIEVLGLVRSARRRLNQKNKNTGQRKIKLPSIVKAESIIYDIDRNFSAHSIFINYEKVHDYYKEKHGCEVNSSKLNFIIGLGLLPLYKFENRSWLLKADLDSILDLFRVPERKKTLKKEYKGLFEKDAISIYSNTRIDIVNKKLENIPTFFSATRNMIAEHKNLMDKSDNNEINIAYFSGTNLSTFSKKVVEYANLQLRREQIVNVEMISQFARSAYYMGSKRALCGFLIEAISSVLPESGVLVDLMCGSGVVSGAFSRIWRTFSSDALHFCRILAVIHSGGFNEIKAKNLISRILPTFKQHFKDLQHYLVDKIDKEDRLFCRNTDESLLIDYKYLLRSFPTLINGASTSHWDPQVEVKNRRKDPSIYPYCLFTTYFSNVYFGIRQSVEIDSLRYSIDQLKDIDEKNWALGALIATVSALGTTYGGHFAQPLVKNEKDITQYNIPSIINKRSSSITHEFAIRLLKLSEQSQKIKRKIEIVQGPWEKALSTLNDKLKNKPVLVYLDAPYTREEYSRYYHVLETLVLYTYPSCSGSGLTPHPRDRFRSEFFTKVYNQITQIIVQIITNILQRGWFCAWSYSDSGAANIFEVINSVHSNVICDIKSYSLPFVHKSQGGKRPKKVTEYLIIFSPKNQHNSI